MFWFLYTNILSQLKIYLKTDKSSRFFSSFHSARQPPPSFRIASVGPMKTACTGWGSTRPSLNYSLLEDWLDVGQGGPGDELVELHWLLPILSHMAEVLMHHHLAGLPP